MTKMLAEETSWQGAIFDIKTRKYHSKEQGNFIREIVQFKNDAVAFGMLDTETNKIYVNQEFRGGINQTIDSIPAGKIDEGETPQQALFREIAEETGFQIDKANIPTENNFHLSHLATINSSEGAVSEKVHLFLIETDFSKIPQTQKQFDKDEYLTGQFLDVNLWIKQTLHTPHSAPAISLAFALMNRQSNKD